MAKSLLYGLFFFFGIIFTGQAQAVDSVKTKPANLTYLLLNKTGKLKRYRFYVGDQIMFRVKNDSRFYSGSITAIKDSAFYFQNTRIPLERVAQIRMRNHTGGKKVLNYSSVVLKSAGSIFTLVGAINFITHSDDRVDGLHTMGAALTMYAAGVGLKALTKRTYNLEKKWQLKVVEMY
ncbi:hypothetical protein [Rufibacter quisquiliarum]|uniref:Uncharacterized protein (UPF0248 family) n=1 Tax=Rufibacter quisquiliarum TaxID=1549639 RepID=A0A839GGS3_9BACT|nr:hypothetical protein [Rufibacter quisquiliarum]MBA9078854.1 uncharacterized protein (UPF0248 family) [Rufibacter quisquiliarum]